MLAFTRTSKAFGNISNARLQDTEDVRTRTADCDGEVGSQYRQEVAHGRIPCMQEKLRLEFSITRRETGIKR